MINLSILINSVGTCEKNLIHSVGEFSWIYEVEFLLLFLWFKSGD